MSTTFNLCVDPTNRSNQQLKEKYIPTKNNVSLDLQSLQTRTHPSDRQKHSLNSKRSLPVSATSA